MATSKGPLTANMRPQRYSSEELTELMLNEIAGRLEPSDYINLGIKLGFEKAALSQFEHNNPHNIKGAITSMLISWRNRHSSSPRDLKKILSEALVNVERSDLAELVSKNDAVSETKCNPWLQYSCTDHGDEEVSLFCQTCLKTICVVCVNSIHHKHSLIALKEHQKELEKRLNDAKADIDVITPRFNELRMLTPLEATATSVSLKEQIIRKFIEYSMVLVKEKEKLLQKAARIESARPKVLDNVSTKLETCTALVGQKGAAYHYYDHIAEFEKAMTAVNRLKEAVSDGGVLTCIDNLEMKFVPLTEISFGRIEPLGWRLVKKIEHPMDKAEWVNACVTLSGRRLAVGYGNGGVDIIQIEDLHRETTLAELKIDALTQTADGALVVCDTAGILRLFVMDGEKNTDVLFVNTQSCSHSLSAVDSHIYLGNTKFDNIEVFDRVTGGSPIRTISTELEPWFISAMKTGNIAITECKVGMKDAVHIMKQDGTVVGRIPGRDNHTPYSTCDQLGNIYVALKHMKSGKVKVKKYSPQGDFIENVTKKLETTTNPRSWIQLSCVSPTELVVCDIESVCVFQRRPTLTDVRNLMKI